jgi:hypothetical protein
MMILKLLGSTLCLISLSATIIDGAIAQSGRAGLIHGARDRIVWNTRAKLALDYNSQKYRDVIADAATLQKLDALDLQTALVTAQAYYLSGDKRGCVKYLRENFYSAKNPIYSPRSYFFRGGHPGTNVIPSLLMRCQTE